MRNEQVCVTQRGGAETMALRTTTMERPDPGHAVVRVEAAGVSYGDVLLRRGVIPGGPKPPYVPGYDIAGVVEEVGAGVTDLHAGQPVAALVTHGGYSERVSVPADRLVPLPDGAGPVEAAAVALDYFIAHQMLHRVAQVRPGQRILVHGASGGVGVAFLQLAALAGIECYGSASTAKQAVVAKFGGHPIDYQEQDFVNVIRALPDGTVDAVFDPIGGMHFHRSYSVLPRGGILVAYGQNAALDNGRKRTLTGAWGFLGGIMAPKLLPDGRRTVFYNAWSLEKSHPEAYRTDLAAVLQLLADGEIAPLIARVAPLSEAIAVHQQLEEGGSNGKVVLAPQQAA